MGDFLFLSVLFWCPLFFLLQRAVVCLLYLEPRALLWHSAKVCFSFVFGVWGFFFLLVSRVLYLLHSPYICFFFRLERLFVLLLLATGLKSALYWVLNFGILCAWMEMGYVLGDISVQGWGGKRWVRWDIHGRLKTDAGLVRSWDVFFFFCCWV